MRYLIAILLLTVSTAFGADIITASVTLTNGTANGDTLTVNSSVRRWTNNVSQTIHIGTNSTAVGSTTNLFRHFGSLAAANASVSYGESNVVKFTSFPGIALTVVADGTWAEVSYATNALTNSVAVTVPWNVPAAAAQTNIWSGVVTGIGQNVVTSTVPYGAPAFAAFASLVATQTVSGPKAFTNRAGLWGGNLSGSEGTNLTIYGSFAAPGPGYAYATQIGTGAEVTNQLATAVGGSSAAHSRSSSAFGAYAKAFSESATAIGTGAEAWAPNSTALGDAAVVAATHLNSTAIGKGAQTTASNQVMLGSATISVKVNKDLSVGGNIVEARLTGTNGIAGSIAFVRNAITSLANGANSVTVGTNTFVEVSGPSGAFTINGLNASPNRDGAFLIVLNQTGQNMTVAHESGTEPTAANRIVTMTGADRATTGNGSATFIYSAAASRWICISFDP